MNAKLIPFIFCLSLFVLFFTNCKKEEDLGPGEKDNVVDPESQARAAEIAGRIFEIPSDPSQVSFEQLQLLDGLGEAKMIGLGEATHGTKEFFDMKIQIIKYLVAQHDIRTIAFETDFGESLIFDEYVTKGTGDLESLMRDTLFFWAWQTEEVRNLLEWMRNHNEGKPESEMLHFIGFDCQLFQDNLTQLKIRTNAIDSSLGAFINDLFVWFPITTSSYVNLSSSTRSRFRQRFQLAEDEIIKRERQLVNEDNRTEYEIIKQLAKVLLQVEDVNNNGGYDIIGFNKRDKFMAENALWISRLFEDHSSTILWAHNTHLAKSRQSDKFTVMGEYIKQALADQYQNLAFSMATGSVTAINDSNFSLTTNVMPPPPKGSVNFVFQASGKEAFLLDLIDIRTNESGNYWLKNKQNFISIGIYFTNNTDSPLVNINLSQSFDYLIHFDKTNHTVLLK